MNRGRGNRIYVYILFIMAVLIASWESDITMAAIGNPNIPDQSIRLRILANSDNVEDQWIKRQVRDAVVQSMDGWVKDAKNIEDARMIAKRHLGDLRQVVSGVLERYGFQYGYQVELAVVPFPTKIYGNQVYPAGNYEALRVQLGSGEGQNWWCVLFPPLCFVNATAGDAVADKKPSQGAINSGGLLALAEKAVPNSAKKDKGNVGEETHVRFFVVDLFEKVKDFLTQLV